MNNRRVTPFSVHDIAHMPDRFQDLASHVNGLIGYAQSEGVLPDDPLCMSLVRLRDELDINTENLRKRLRKGWK